MHRFIKAVGSGAKRARALDREEARQAMVCIAGGEAEPVQVGAFLLALRMKGETAEELAGFVDGLADFVRRPGRAPAGPFVDVDAHGDGRGASLLPAAACAAAACGVKACLEVDLGSPFARHGLDGALAALGLRGTLDAERVARDLDRVGVAACDLSLSCPPIARLIGLRPLLGVRTAAQTIAKLVSPFSDEDVRRAVGVFHAPYLEPTARALGLLGAPSALVVQALGGLPEARPGKLIRVARASDGVARTLDLRGLPAPVEEAAPRPAPSDDSDDGGDEPPRPLDGAAENRAPLDGAAKNRALLDGAAENRALLDGAAENRALLDGAAENRAALDGTEGAARRAAATAGLLIHVATGADPVAAAVAALTALRDGRARAVARRLAAA